jgi:prolipoprotein diacylglyceryl transferase
VNALAGAVLASIPSPSSGTLQLGPLRLNAYGLMIALGVIAAVWVFGRRMERMGIGTRDDAASVAIWAVAAGVIGARLYHIVTSWSSDFSKHPIDMLKVWQGGLGIPGGLLAGVLVGVWRVYRRGLPVGWAITAATPGLPLAQAIGRWGNWWNQELFGRPTKLPWALEIHDDKLPVGYASGTTFHPTFLYESLGCLAIVGLLLLIEHRKRLRPGRLMAIYVAMYSFLRFWVEGLRIDPAHKAGGLRLNEWVALVVFVAAVAYLVIDAIVHRGEPAPAMPSATDLPPPEQSDQVEQAEAHEEVEADEEPLAEVDEVDESLAEVDEPLAEVDEVEEPVDEVDEPVDVVDEPADAAAEPVEPVEPSEPEDDVRDGAARYGRNP